MSKKKRAKLKPDAWMPVFIGDYLADTGHLTTEQHGAYQLLLMAMWRNGARLENDDEQLAAITRLPLPRWKACRKVLLRFFTMSDGFLYQKRLSEEYAHAWAVYGKRVESGKKGGRPSGDLFEDNRTETERFTERGSISPPQSQPQSQPPSLPTPSASVETPAAGADGARASMDAAKALARAGIEVAHNDPLLTAALAEGITADELAGLAGTKKGKGKGLGYLVATLRGRRADATAAYAVPAPPPYDPGRDLRREVEAEICDARHLCDTLGMIDPATRDARIAAARARLEQPA